MLFTLLPGVDTRSLKLPRQTDKFRGISCIF